ncbi:MAG: hypothetical protein KAR40_17265 [Candidatus Sabulitectum sp.]|nr:hypothetical protein [Candidatus Sabulitectum sp.]
MTRRKKNSQNRLIILPYALSMKAYAFAGKSYKYAMEQLSLLALETPRLDVESHTIYWDLMEDMYDDYQREARRISRDRIFSKAQLETLGIDPFYTWIKEDENPSVSFASAFTQDVIDEMQHFRMRQIVSVLLRLEETPEMVEKELQRQGFTNWRIEHISFYHKFFWNTTKMTHEDWLNYLYFANPYRVGHVDENGCEWSANPHFTYLKDITTMECAETLRYKCRLPINSSISDMDRDIQKNLGCMIKEAMRVGDTKSTAVLLVPYTRMANMLSAKNDEPVNAELREMFESLRIIATPAQAKRYGVDMKELGYVEPIGRDEIEGEISDPRDTGRNRFLDSNGYPKKN